MQFRQRSILIMDINLENSVSVEIRTSYAVRYTEKKLHTYVSTKKAITQQQN